MIKPKVTGNKVVIGPCRLSYTHLFEKYSFDNGGDGKYMTNVLIPKKEKETVEAVKAAMENAKKEGLLSKWKGKAPKSVDLPLRDGDDKEDSVYDGHYYLNAKSSKRPYVVDANKEPITDEEEVYSGIWAIVAMEFFPYDTSGNKGIGCSLRGIQKKRDGERLGGSVSAEDDLDGIEDDDDDL